MWKPQARLVAGPSQSKAKEIRLFILPGNKGNKGTRKALIYNDSSRRCLFRSSPEGWEHGGTDESHRSIWQPAPHAAATPLEGIIMVCGWNSIPGGKLLGSLAWADGPPRASSRPLRIAYDQGLGVWRVHFTEQSGATSCVFFVQPSASQFALVAAPLRNACFWLGNRMEDLERDWV